jgi:hypothetical protein
MIVIVEGESLRIPATVAGNKNLISNLSAVIKRSQRGEVPAESATVVATLTVDDYDSAEINDGYIFELINTSSLTKGIYYVNFEYVVAGRTYKGEPLKVVVKESVV